MIWPSYENQRETFPTEVYYKKSMDAQMLSAPLPVTAKCRAPQKILTIIGERGMKKSRL